MKFSPARLFPVLLMAVLALLTFWLKRTVSEQAPAATVVRHDPDYIVHQFTITSFDSKGIPESRLSAAKMVHYADDDSTQFVAPHLVQTKPDQPRMTVSAERGTLVQGGEEVFLYGDVHLQRAATATRPAASMVTSFLHIARGGTLLLTDREVSITEGTRTLSGRGMQYNNATGELLLHHQVRGRFEPKASG